MLCFPNAKINIGLNVVSKRTDGFHNIETVFYPIGLQDIIEITPTSTHVEFINTGVQINGNETDNLVVKVYQYFKENYQLPNIKLHLHKQIPFGAGLGGGSADAAFTAVALNRQFELNLPNEQLEAIVSIFGSDCAFFVKNTPAFGFGRGNELSEINLNLSGYYLVLVNPGIHVATKDAYSLINPAVPLVSVSEAIKQPITEWKYVLSNDFERSVFTLFPEIENLKEQLYKLGALYAQMSGSGSSVFGIFSTEPDEMAFNSNYFVWKGKL
ncbi:MAG TPA: 4-(cytidine 5'-diphospho)-2-C-methyl-D-erythritol kinase [Bacteroidales bacterium]|nr:4-(cytidine 5'-diphospho)-2-C-methyl-D-erythritol kinase [Bacteroidales bacterium]